MVPPLVHSVGELEQSVYNINSNTGTGIRTESFYKISIATQAQALEQSVYNINSNTGTGIRTEWFYKISIAIHAQASEQNVLQYQ